MKYFSTLPQIQSTDYSGNLLTMTNLLAKSEIIPSLLKNPMIFYQYDTQDGDTPEIVADKYYGDSYRYWLVLFSNQILDPQWDWPLSNKQFQDYIIDKYSTAAGSTDPGVVIPYMQGTVYQYTKTITTIDSTTSSQTTRIIVIDENTFNATVTGTTYQTFPDSSDVTQIVSVNEVSLYDYEFQLNESKRTINLINSIYAAEIESEFKSLMGA